MDRVYLLVAMRRSILVAFLASILACETHKRPHTVVNETDSAANKEILESPESAVGDIVFIAKLKTSEVKPGLFEAIVDCRPKNDIFYKGGSSKESGMGSSKNKRYSIPASSCGLSDIREVIAYTILGDSLGPLLFDELDLVITNLDTTVVAVFRPGNKISNYLAASYVISSNSSNTTYRLGWSRVSPPFSKLLFARVEIQDTIVASEALEINGFPTYGFATTHTESFLVEFSHSSGSKPIVWKFEQCFIFSLQPTHVQSNGKPVFLANIQMSNEGHSRPRLLTFDGVKYAPSPGNLSRIGG